nr:alpha-L-fucosidase [Pirellulaceae bacterium]
MNDRKLKILALVAAVLCGGGPLAAAETKPRLPHVETPAEREARLAWWREARFGLFIHWGPSSVSGKEISW